MVAGGQLPFCHCPASLPCLGLRKKGRPPLCPEPPCLVPPSIAYRAMGRGPHLSVPLLCPETWGESRSTPPPRTPRCATAAGRGRDSGRAILAAAAAAAEEASILMLWASLPTGTESSQPGGAGGALPRNWGNTARSPGSSPWPHPCPAPPALSWVASLARLQASLRPLTSGPGWGWGVAPVSPVRRS